MPALCPLKGLAGLNSTHVAGRSEPGADQAQGDPDANDSNGFDGRHAHDDDAALIQDSTAF